MTQIALTPEELEDMLDRAANRGARQALRDIGLADDEAHKDIHELRDLLDTYRETRKGVWSTVVKFLTVAVLTFIATSVWMELGNTK